MFKLHKKGSAATEAIEYIEGTASENIVVGELLVLNAGKLTKCGATAVPEFVSLGSGNGDIIPVKRIYEDEEYETTAQAAYTSIVPGNKVTIHTDGLQATATTTSGVFTIVGMDGTAAGSKVRGMFRR